MEAARWAASSFNEQPWSFLVARRSDEEEFQRMLGCLVQGNRGWAGKAPILIITVARRSFTRNGKPNRHAFHDVGLAVGNLSTQATGLGLVLHQMAGFDPEQARKSYSIPEEFEAVTAIALGYGVDPASLSEEQRENESSARQRKPLSEFVFQGKWGQSAI
jgi:nitroreductase